MLTSRLRSLFVASVAALTAASLGLSASARADTQVCPAGPFVQGVDVSGGEGQLDWQMAAANGIQFAFMKATQGNYFTDSEFAANWAGTQDAGIIRGAYHFFDATVDGVDQANYFLSVVGTMGPNDLPPVLDIECPDDNGDDDCLGNGSSGQASAATILQVMMDFLNTVQAATGRLPIVYTFDSFFSENGVDTTGFNGYPLWMSYPTTDACFEVPSPWTSAPFWQYSFDGDVPGIGGGGDLDQFLGTFAELQAFISGGAVFAAPAQANGNDALSIVSWPDGHMDLFGTQAAGSAEYFTSFDGGDAWAGTELSGPAACGVASVTWAPGSGHTSEVFDGLPTGGTEVLEWESGAYTAFSSFGGTGLSHLSTLAYPDGHIEVFALGADGAIWHNVSTPSSWDGWTSMGGSFVTGAGPILWNDGHAEIFAADATGTPWHASSDTLSPPNWQGWSALAGGPIASRPVAARWADGHVEVFARGTNGVLYTSDFADGGYPPFTTLNPTQTIQGDPSVLVYAHYGPEIFARDPDGNLIHMWNGSGTWSAWANDFGQTLASDPLAWMRPDGLAEVFGIDAQGDLLWSLHDGPTWSSFSQLGTGFNSCLGGVTGLDGGSPRVDAGEAPPDAGHPLVDAGHEEVDAGHSHPITDAGREVADAGPQHQPTDGGAQRSVDAGPETRSPDAGAETKRSSAGCSCGGGTSDLLGSAGMVLLMAARQRRRLRLR